MARRRFQDPRPFREGHWWWIKTREDVLVEGRYKRKQKRVKVCPADTPDREARKIAAEVLRPINQGLQTIGSASKFADYVNNTYRPVVLPQLASTTQANYEGTLRKYLMPAFGEVTLRELTTLRLQGYFSKLSDSDLGGDTVSAMRQVLSAVLGSAVLYELLSKNPVLGVRLPKSKIVNKRKRKAHISPEEFFRLLQALPEPYATMVFVAVFSGLRISEVIGLKWEDVGEDSLTVDERCCRGDWSETKTEASFATIGISSAVSTRLQSLKTLEIDVPWGGQGATKKIKAVRSDGPHDLVFQSIRKGAAMNDQNILRRHLRPAAIRLGLDPKKATWRSLRTSCATWMIEAGADPKSVQAQMRHSRISTTMDIYAQNVPESQRRAINQTAEMATERFRAAKAASELVQ